MRSPQKKEHHTMRNVALPLSNGDVGIVTILHERMHHMDRFRDTGRS
ncbi:hypothetical protein [Rhodovulum strictum]